MGQNVAEVDCAENITNLVAQLGFVDVVTKAPKQVTQEQQSNVIKDGNQVRLFAVERHAPESKHG